MPPSQPLLRNQLVTWVLAPLLLLLAADTFVSYRVALSFAQRAYDRSLVEIAREISLHLHGADGRVELDLPEEARRVLLSDTADRVWFAVATRDGRVLAGDDIPPAAHGARGAPQSEAFYDARVEGAPVRVVEVQVAADASSGRPGALVRVAETEAKRNGLAREILASVIVPQLLLIVIAGAVVWVGVVRGLSPLERLRGALAARSHRDRSPVAAHDVPGEVMPLVDSINELLARLDKALTLQSRFIADAAHQLKTPIAAVRTELELAQRQGDPAQARQSIASAHAGLERLSRLASQLLSLARNEPEAAGAVQLAALDLDALVLEVAKEWVPAALRRDIDLGFEPSGQATRVRGDAARLRELLDNLLDNAVRYTRDGGRITVRVTAAGIVEVSDDGPSIPPSERVRVFERFHRLLGNSKDGSGLGLAIAQEIARIHGTEILLREDADGIGNTFSVALPRA
jgi:two-component system sensor histidine kinase TctE